MRTKTLVPAAVAAALLAASVIAFAAPADDPAKARHDAMEQVGDAMKGLGKMAKGQAPFDAAVVATNATTIKERLEQASKLFPPGSDTGETKAKPEVWSERAGFDKIMSDGIASAAALCDGEGRGRVPPGARRARPELQGVPRQVQDARTSTDALAFPADRGRGCRPHRLRPRRSGSRPLPTRCRPPRSRRTVPTSPTAGRCSTPAAVCGATVRRPTPRAPIRRCLRAARLSARRSGPSTRRTSHRTATPASAAGASSTSSTRWPAASRPGGRPLLPGIPLRVVPPDARRGPARPARLPHEFAARALARAGGLLAARARSRDAASGCGRGSRAAATASSPSRAAAAPGTAAATSCTPRATAASATPRATR